MAGLAAAFGSGAMTNSIEELAGADTIFVIGSNTTAAHPLVADRLYRAKKNGATIIVADPRKIQLALTADLYVSQALGSDAALINGIAHIIIKEGWQNQQFIDDNTEGYEEFKAMVQGYTPERTTELTGVSAEDLYFIAEKYAKAPAGSIVYCMGITQHTSGVDNVKSLANLAMLTGQIGRESTGVNPLRGQNNVQGACDMGGLPDVYPGYQKVDVPEIQAKFAKAWGAELSPKAGLKIPDMLSGLNDGSVKALIVVGENPMMSDPDQHHVEQALKKTELLVVQDIFDHQTAQLAHVVLPGASYAEKDGTFSNTERRIQRLHKAVEPVGDSKADWEITQEISNRFGYPMNYASPSEIMDEIATVTPQYAGISFERLEGEGLLWPCPTQDHPGTKFLHAGGKFARGKGLFHAIEWRAPAEVVDEEYPLWLTTGRAHVHYHTGTMTRNSPSLHALMPEGFAEINPVEAERLGVSEGEMLQLTTRRGTIQAKAMITDRVRPGMVFVPFHFMEACANVLTNPALDPVCKIPEFKVCAVKLDKAA
ncbi:MAG: formate dehydrogenase subunit alpha [Desulfarculaceae bacterium]|nr:formate dehydrogenase subunit alpha [Desulfarculaceae bacterium]MCF8047049.1 formate dehydrogenase subunit alpha [Desulfarculaceae bacterium]MCF8097261.1 formate dehydrogenase subunit alpha [Desulfarculaceae bacterium]MCF8122154.1 formate dehydrogenase subunit alpha [Desulfarculaceae bacterium]